MLPRDHSRQACLSQFAEGKQPVLCPGSLDYGHLAPAHTCPVTSSLSCDQKLALLHHGRDSMQSLKRAPQSGPGLGVREEGQDPHPHLPTPGSLQFCPLGDKLALTQDFPSCPCQLSPEHSPAWIRRAHTTGRVSVKSSRGLVSCENTSSSPDAKRSSWDTSDPQAGCIPPA